MKLMPEHMEGPEKRSLLFLLVVLQICTIRTDDCQSQQKDRDLTCYTDYNCTIRCAWHSVEEFGSTNTACKLHASRSNARSVKRRYSAAADCVMEPGLKQGKCNLSFKKPGNFQSSHELNITLRCNAPELIVTMKFKPANCIKVDPPAKPNINSTTVSWFTQMNRHKDIEDFKSELQWKRLDQEWNAMQTKTKGCKWECEAELDSDSLTRGDTYEARVRVLAVDKLTTSVWSEWSPTSSWVSPVGVEQAPPTLPFGSDFPWVILGLVIGAAVAVVLVCFLIKHDNVTWVYRKIKGHPPPDPGKSFLGDLSFMGWWGPHFTTASLDSFLQKEDIVPVEIISPVNAVCSKEAALLDKMRSENSLNLTSSSFSSPIYFNLFASAQKVSPNLGNQEPRDSDAQDHAVRSLNEGSCAENNDKEERIKELMIRQLLLSSNRSKALEVVSDYERVEKRDSGQGLDSFVCSGEQLSQESLECTSVIDENLEEPERVMKDEAHEEDAVFQKLFGGGVGNVFGRGSVLVCSDYEKIQKLEPGSPELPSLDSGVSCEDEDEEQLSHEESPEVLNMSNESTKGLSSTPLLPSVSATPFFSFPHGALRINPTGFSPTPGPSNLNDLIWRLNLTSVPRSTEPAGDGYMPVKQELR